MVPEHDLPDPGRPRDLLERIVPQSAGRLLDGRPVLPGDGPGVERTHDELDSPFPTPSSNERLVAVRFRTAQPTLDVDGQQRHVECGQYRGQHNGIHPATETHHDPLAGCQQGMSATERPYPSHPIIHATRLRTDLQAGQGVEGVRHRNPIIHAACQFLNRLASSSFDIRTAVGRP